MITFILSILAMLVGWVLGIIVSFLTIFVEKPLLIYSSSEPPRIGEEIEARAPLVSFVFGILQVAQCRIITFGAGVWVYLYRGSDITVPLILSFLIGAMMFFHSLSRAQAFYTHGHPGYYKEFGYFVGEIVGFVVFLLILQSLGLFHGVNTRYNQAEIEEMKKFRNAQELFLKSGRFLKEITSSPIVGTIEKDDLEKYLSMLNQALSDANSISPKTLEKIHPELPEAYKEIFIKSFEERINSFKEFSPQSAINATNLYNEWIVWWNKHLNEFRF